MTIATFLWKILSLEFIMFNDQKVGTNIKKISLVYSFWSLFRFQNIRNEFLKFHKTSNKT